MPKILITGNGFDLNFGLPTSYNDFVQILNYIDKKIAVDHLEFEELFSNSSNFEVIKNNFKSFKFDYNKIDDLKEKMQANLWFQFFKDEFEIESWIDFENKIEYVLQILFTSIDYIKNNIFSKGSLQMINLNYDYMLFNNNVEIIEVLNKFRIIGLGSQKIRLNKIYLTKKYGHYIDVDLDKITKHLYEELENFKKIFNYYFEIFVFPFYDNLKNKIDVSLFSNFERNYTFNYTPTFINFFGNHRITSFLHGKIDSSSNKIVIGINEIPKNNVDNKYFLPFTKYFQKLNNNTDYIFLKEYENRKNDNFIFCFWGHSLDKSDEDYINEIFDFVNSLKSRIKKIIVVYHNNDSKEKLLVNLLNIRGKKDIQELMRSKILLFINSNSKELKDNISKDILRHTHSMIV